MEIGERIRHFRKDTQGMTQEEFARKINVSRANIASIEKGRISVTDRVISDICNSFSVSEEWLRTGSGEMLQETEETLFSSFAAHYDLSANEQALARYLLDLSSEERQAVLKHILAMADAIRGSQQAAPPARPSEPDPGKVDPIEQELSDYRKELEAEKKGIRSPASGTGNEKRA